MWDILHVDHFQEIKGETNIRAGYIYDQPVRIKTHRTRICTVSATFVF